MNKNKSKYPRASNEIYGEMRERWDFIFQTKGKGVKIAGANGKG